MAAPTPPIQKGPQGAFQSIWKKFMAPPNFLEREAETETMDPGQKISFQRFMKQLDLLIHSTNSENERMQYEIMKAELTADVAQKKISEDFVEDFIKWILGRHPKNVVQEPIRVDPQGVPVDTRDRPIVTPWGNKPYTHLEDVKEFIDGMVNKRMQALDYLTKLQVNWPRNLVELWIYWKYIVNEEGIDRDGVIHYLPFLGPYDFIPPSDVPYDPVNDKNVYYYDNIQAQSAVVNPFDPRNPNPPAYDPTIAPQLMQTFWDQVKALKNAFAVGEMSLQDMVQNFVLGDAGLQNLYGFLIKNDYLYSSAELTDMKLMLYNEFNSIESPEIRAFLTTYFDLPIGLGPTPPQGRRRQDLPVFGHNVIDNAIADAVIGDGGGAPMNEVDRGMIGRNIAERFTNIIAKLEEIRQEMASRKEPVEKIQKDIETLRRNQQRYFRFEREDYFNIAMLMSKQIKEEFTDTKNLLKNVSDVTKKLVSQAIPVSIVYKEGDALRVAASLHRHAPEGSDPRRVAKEGVKGYANIVEEVIDLNTVDRDEQTKILEDIQAKKQLERDLQYATKLLNKNADPRGMKNLVTVEEGIENLRSEKKEVGRMRLGVAEQVLKKNVARNTALRPRRTVATNSALNPPLEIQVYTEEEMTERRNKRKQEEDDLAIALEYLAQDVHDQEQEQQLSRNNIIDDGEEEEPDDGGTTSEEEEESFEYQYQIFDAINETEDDINEREERAQQALRAIARVPPDQADRIRETEERNRQYAGAVIDDARITIEDGQENMRVGNNTIQGLVNELLGAGGEDNAELVADILNGTGMIAHGIGQVVEGERRIDEAINIIDASEASTNHARQEAANEDRSCKACLDAEATILYKCCNQLVYCEECRQQSALRDMNNCPLCRGDPEGYPNLDTDVGTAVGRVLKQRAFLAQETKSGDIPVDDEAAESLIREVITGFFNMGGSSLKNFIDAQESPDDMIRNRVAARKVWQQVVYRYNNKKNNNSKNSPGLIGKMITLGSQVLFGDQSTKKKRRNPSNDPVERRRASVEQRISSRTHNNNNNNNNNNRGRFETPSSPILEGQPADVQFTQGLNERLGDTVPEEELVEAHRELIDSEARTYKQKKEELKKRLGKNIEDLNFAWANCTLVDQVLTKTAATLQAKNNLTEGEQNLFLKINGQRAHLKKLMTELGDLMNAKKTKIDGYLLDLETTYYNIMYSQNHVASMMLLTRLFERMNFLDLGKVPNAVSRGEYNQFYNRLLARASDVLKNPYLMQSLNQDARVLNHVTTTIEEIMEILKHGKQNLMLGNLLIKQFKKTAEALEKRRREEEGR